MQMDPKMLPTDQLMEKTKKDTTISQQEYAVPCLLMPRWLASNTFSQTNQHMVKYIDEWKADCEQDED